MVGFGLCQRWVTSTVVLPFFVPVVCWYRNLSFKCFVYVVNLFWYPVFTSGATYSRNNVPVECASIGLCTVRVINFTRLCDCRCTDPVDRSLAFCIRSSVPPHQVLTNCLHSSSKIFNENFQIPLLSVGWVTAAVESDFSKAVSACPTSSGDSVVIWKIETEE